jgi:protein TonB
LPSRSSVLNSGPLGSPLTLSLAAHGALACGIGLLLLAGRIHFPEKVEITVIDVPQSPRAIQVSKPEPKKAEPPKPRAVFGMSRKAVTADAKDGGEAVKLGNTVTKAPDNEKLRPDDADALPVPTEEYLVTQMPELAQEVRIPYPALAKQKGAQGSVIMDLLIDSNGSVRQAEFIQGPEESLNQAAMAAVKGFVFKPAKLQDKAVAVKIRYAYKFVLERG